MNSEVSVAANLMPRPDIEVKKRGSLIKGEQRGGVVRTFYLAHVFVMFVRLVPRTCTKIQEM